MTAAATASKERYPQAAALSISIAGDVCENRFLFRDHWEMERTHVPVCFNGQIDWARIPAGDPEWLYAMNRHTSFVNLGKAWRYTGEVRYARQFAALIEDWIDRVPLTKESARDTWRSLEAGLRCESWLRALRLFENSGVLGNALRSKIDGCLRVHADYLLETSGDFHKLSNWGVLQDHGLFLLSVYFDDPDLCKVALERLDNNLHCSVMRDGSHWEQSPMYHCEVLHCVADTLLIARQNGIAAPERLVKNVHAMCKALAAWVKPDGRLVCQSDSDDTDARDLLAQGALLFGDGTLKAMAGESLREENIWDFGAEASVEYDAIPANRSACSSAALTDSGNYTLRCETGWAHLHCGCLGSGHGHADLLHLDAGAGGEDVLIDSGRHNYVDSPLRRQLKQPAAHNTTRVDGEDFSVCVDSWGYSRIAIPVKGEHAFTPEADFVSGIHLGYFARGVITGRKVVFLKKAGVIAVFDQFYTDGSHSYEQFFHFGRGTSLLCGDNVRWQGEKTAARLVCVGDGLAFSLGKAPYSPDYNKLCEGDVLTVSGQGDGFFSFVTVLSMDTDGAEHPLRVEKLPVSKLRAGVTLADEQAQALSIEKDGERYTILLCHGEVISEVDLLAAGGYMGYGKALVFSKEHPDGLCLTW